MYEVLLISTLAGLATGLGGLIVIIYNKPTVKFLSLLLGLAAGINIVIATVELLPAAIAHGNLPVMCLGFILGTLAMQSIDHLMPSTGLFVVNGSPDLSRLLKMGYLIAISLAVHNLPEGLAIGAGFMATHSLGTVIALAIGIHNIPEGMCAAVPLKMAGINGKRILLVTCLAGLATPLGTLLGTMLINMAREFISFSLAFGGGAIMYVVSKELIPESNKLHSQYAILGITLGFLAAITLSFNNLI